MKSRLWRVQILALVLALVAGPALAAEWRTEPLSDIDRQYMAQQHDALNALARRNLGRQLNGRVDNDLAVLQRLLDEGVVGKDQVELLQGMGLELGELLKREKGLHWIAYSDERGRSRSLQVPGFDKDFIFPTTQISRLAEVGIKVDVRAIYKELEQAVTDIRNKPPL